MGIGTTINVELDEQTYNRLASLAALTDSGIPETAKELLRIMLARIAQGVKDPAGVQF